jgi:bilin biosynthesis protein
MTEAPAEIPGIDQLIKDLEHPNPYVQTEAFLALLRHWPDESLPRLLNLLDQENVTLRRASVRAIGAFGEKALIPLAKKFEQSADATVRASCVKAYAQVASNYRGITFPVEAINSLENALQDESPVVALAAVMALGQVGEPALELLMQVCKGDNPALAVAGVNAMVEIKDPQISAYLKDLLQRSETDSYVKETIESALSRVDLLQV